MLHARPGQGCGIPQIGGDVGSGRGRGRDTTLGEADDFEDGGVIAPDLHGPDLAGERLGRD